MEKRQKIIHNDYDGDDEKAKQTIYSDGDSDGDQPPVKEILGGVAWYEFITKLQNLKKIVFRYIVIVIVIDIDIFTC